jgi:hypothetical protein
MPAPLDAILKQIDEVLKQYENYSPRTDQYGEDHSKAGTAEAITRLKGAIDRLAVAPSPYRESADALLKQYGVTNSYSVKFLVGILKALRADYVAGYLHTVESLIHADVFADFLEMADHLLSQNYKDPAAVIIGSVLEEHLRKLCAKQGIPTVSGTSPKKADTLNAELTAANVYSKLDQKNVTAWLDLRNKAAHGHYAQYTQQQVELLSQSVRDFMTRNPA